MKFTGRYLIPNILFAMHMAALIFGLVGILIMLPNPDIWSGDPFASDVFNWSMENAGATHIIFGAACMFAYGVVAIGWVKTVIFAVTSFVLSLSFELFGTGTGWPFGNYEYTDFLGYKILGLVPYSIPLSWFYMGFASYLLGSLLVNRFGLGRQTLWTVLSGAFLLLVWDLVLDPAMAHESLRIQFWVWDETGPYMGMPTKNFAGWAITGLLFMLVSRLLWKEDVDARNFSMTLPFAIYAANLFFAMVLSAEVGLWIPIVLALVLGLLPAIIAMRPKSFDDTDSNVDVGSTRLARDA